MRTDEPDLIVNWTPKSQLYGSWAACLAGLNDRLAWWQHGVPSGHWMERLATVTPAMAVGCSSAVAAAAQARLRPKRPIFVVHPGIEPDAPFPVSREELGIPSERVVVGIVGRLQPQKGQHRFLEAVAALRDRGRDVHALLVGGTTFGLSPEYPRLLERRIEELGLRDRITMTGHVADPRAYIPSMDILASASAGESFGIVLLEAMSLGVPVIAPADGGASDILEHDVSGVLIAQPQVPPLIDALERLIIDPDRRIRIGSAGRERFFERFTASAMTEQLQARFKALCEQAPDTAALMTA